MNLKYFLDKRFIVNGKKSHINMDNYLRLDTYILNVVGQFTALPYTFINGLTDSSSTVTWGGDLTQTTTINGLNAYGVNLLGLTDFEVSAINSLTITADNILYLQTPDYDNRPVGAILQLLDFNTGEAEYTPYSLPTTDGLIMQYLTTNGVGEVEWTYDNYSTTEVLTDKFYAVDSKPIYRKVIDAGIFTVAGDETNTAIFDSGIDSVDRVISISASFKFTAGPITGASGVSNLGDGSAWSGACVVLFDGIDTLLSWENIYRASELATNQPHFHFIVEYTKN